MKPTVAPIHLSPEMNKFQTKYDNTVKQIKNDYSYLMKQITKLDSFSSIHKLDKAPKEKEEMLVEQYELIQKAGKEKLSPTEEKRLAFLNKLFTQYQLEKLKQENKHSKQVHKCAIEFSRQVINNWSLLQMEAKTLGIELNILPYFIKSEDLRVITHAIHPMFNIFASSDAWLRRLIGEKNAYESRQEFKERIHQFTKEEVDVREDKNSILPALNRFEKGILKDFNAYSMELNRAKEIIKSLKTFSDPAGNDFQVAASDVLSKLENMSATLIKQEEVRFTTTNAYKNIGNERDKRGAVIAHMSKFTELLPFQAKLLFIENILKSQKPAGFIEFEEAQENFAPLFTNKKFISKLSELHKAFTRVESARLAYLDAEEKADQPSRKRPMEEVAAEPDYRCVKRKFVKRASIPPTFFSAEPLEVKQEQEEKTRQSSHKRPMEEVTAEPDYRCVKRKFVKRSSIPSTFFSTEPLEKKPEQIGDLVTDLQLVNQSQ